jgi:hypothetical protein
MAIYNTGGFLSASKIHMTYFAFHLPKTDGKTKESGWDSTPLVKLL